MQNMPERIQVGAFFYLYSKREANLFSTPLTDPCYRSDCKRCNGVHHLTILSTCKLSYIKKFMVNIIEFKKSDYFVHKRKDLL